MEAQRGNQGALQQNFWGVMNCNDG
jgi:hypothetical protein